VPEDAKQNEDSIDQIAVEETTEEQSRDTDKVLGTTQAQSLVNETPSEIEQPTAIAPVVKKKHPKRKLMIVLAVLLLLAGSGVTYWFGIRESSTSEQQSTPEATKEVQRFGVAVGLSEGAVEYSTDRSVSWQKLDTEVELKEGDYIRTLTDGRIVLLVDDGSAVRLGANSTVALKSLETTDVVITNVAGEVYSRVTASSSRRYTVAVEDSEYTAKGTAYRTTNTATKKGVEVFHSAVTKDTTEVPEGNAFYTNYDQKEKENVVSALDLTALKKDEFIKWNSEQDKKQAEFATALGVLSELDKPDPTPPAVPAPSSNSSAGISLSGSVSEFSAVFSWKVSGVNTSQGFKLVRSKSSQTPTYPENSIAYVEAGKTSYNLYVGDGKTYYYRICAYRGDSCVSYSNTVTLTTPVKEVEKPTSGVVTLAISGTTASWTFGGTAPHGFKLVISQAPSTPSYGSALKTNYTGSPHEINYLGTGTYNVRVCKYTASDFEGGCMDYSNQVQITVP
jgi:ferric-dicitrate binding protein FerR (iron transport regulator)